MLGTISYTEPGRNQKVCILCCSCEPGLGHLLGHCAALEQQRRAFLSRLDGRWRIDLESAVPYAWAISLLTPHMDLSRLHEIVHFCAEVAKEFGPIKMSTLLVSDTLRVVTCVLPFVLFWLCLLFVVVCWCLQYGRRQFVGTCWSVCDAPVGGNV